MKRISVLVVLALLMCAMPTLEIDFNDLLSKGKDSFQFTGLDANTKYIIRVLGTENLNTFFDIMQRYPINYGNIKATPQLREVALCVKVPNYRTLIKNLESIYYVIQQYY